MLKKLNKLPGASLCLSPAVCAQLHLRSSSCHTISSELDKNHCINPSNIKLYCTTAGGATKG